MEVENENLDGFIQAINALTSTGLSTAELCSVLAMECLLSDDILECVILKITNDIDAFTAQAFATSNHTMTSASINSSDFFLIFGKL
ncbi:MAG: hypothetical protein KC713_10070 [Candidatus Omnitrophica bacterium]|nr:hypothetical protein [Candidatus Omnitrophota bacterium]